MSHQLVPSAAAAALTNTTPPSDGGLPYDDDMSSTPSTPSQPAVYNNNNTSTHTTQKPQQQRAPNLAELKQYEQAFRRFSAGSERMPVACLADLLSIMGLSVTRDEITNYSRVHAIQGTLSFPSVVEIYCEHTPKEAQFLSDYLAFCSLLDPHDTGYVSVADLRQALCSLGDALSDQELNHLLYAKGLLGKARLSVFEIVALLLNVPV